MPELLRHSAGNPEFARVLDLSHLRGASEFAFDIAPDAGEMPAIARLLGAQAVRKLRFAGRLSALPQGGWRLGGELGATVIQTCVVTLDAVTTRIDQPVRRSFLPQQQAGATDIVISIEEDDETEPLRGTVDLGLVALEALALALPDYPRKPGAALEVADEVPVPEDEDEKPFATLATLKDKLGGAT